MPDCRRLQRDILTAALQELVEAEITATIVAAPGERTTDRVTQRNGHRPKLLSTPGDDVEIGIPKLRQGSLFATCWSCAGGSTKRCGGGCDSGISKSTVSRICTQIDADVHALRTRRLDHHRSCTSGSTPNLTNSFEEHTTFYTTCRDAIAPTPGMQRGWGRRKGANSRRYATRAGTATNG